MASADLSLFSTAARLRFDSPHLSALLEDFFYRGFLLSTLASGLSFWPAAIATSLLMGGMHYFNPGGHGLGPASVTLYCLVACLVLRRTGDLWMGHGIHTARSWGEVFFVGIPSSGRITSQGHLLTASFHGPTWLTGGTFGPEADCPISSCSRPGGSVFPYGLREFNTQRRKPFLILLREAPRPQLNSAIAARTRVIPKAR